MSIPATEAVTPTGMYQSPAAATPGSSSDKEMFLNLMVAQLRYQDPLNPTDSGEFLAQNAQCTALEKMQDVADQTAALLSAQISFGAAGMVGKDVTYLTEDGTPASGVVGSVTYDASGPLLQIGDDSVTLGQISSISAPASASPATAPSTSTATAG
jgi:flagellar basal-body rod modification protein FlgD